MFQGGKWREGESRTFGQHAVGTIGTGDSGKGVGTLVVSLVVRNANGSSESSGDSGESSEDGSELHDECVKRLERLRDEGESC